MENSCHIALIDGLPSVINVKLHWYLCVITGMMLLNPQSFFISVKKKIIICGNYQGYKQWICFNFFV